MPRIVRIAMISVGVPLAIALFYIAVALLATVAGVI